MKLADVINSEIKDMLDNLVKHGKECAAQKITTPIRAPRRVYVRGRKAIARVPRKQEG